MSLEELEVRKITEKVLKEQNLYNLTDLYKKEHNIFRGTHKELPLHYTKEALDNFFEGEDQDKKQIHWDRITSKPSTYPPSSHEHDDRYYTESEINTLLAAQNEFKELGDTPASYASEGGKGIRVKTAEDGLEFYSLVDTDELTKVGVAGVADYLNENYFERDVSNHIRIKQNTLLTGVNVEKLGGQLGSYYSPTIHTHLKVDITDTPWVWGDVLKTGSNLTDLVTRLHSSLHSIGADDHHAQVHTHASHTSIGANDHHPQLHASAHLVGGADPLSVGVPVSIGIALLEGTATNFARRDHVHTHPDGLGANRHHPQLHAAEHEIGGAGDLVHHDNLSGFVVSEHTSLPNTIAAVLSDHNAAAHNSLGIDHGSLSGKEDDDHSIYYNATRHTKAIHDALALDHGFLGGRGDDDHSIYYNAARHTKAIHDALGINADTLDTIHAISFALKTRALDTFGATTDITTLNATTAKHGLLMKLGGGTTNFLRADGAWEVPVLGAHAASHLVGAGDPLSVGVPVSIGIALLEGTATNFARRDHVHTHPDGLGANRHHPQLHAAEHEIGGAGDLVNHDNLTGFVVSEHTSLPNTIAAVLSNHTQAVHNALNIDADTLDTLHAASFALTTRKLDDFGTPDDNTDLNASTTRHGLLRKLSGVTANFLRGDGVWANPTLGAHASTHELGGGDIIHHNDLTDYAANVHQVLPNTIAVVLNDHNVANHNSLGIDHGSLGGKGDDDHTQYYNATRHTKAIHDTLAIDHGSLGGRGDDDHSVYYNAARHTKAIHDALNIDADTLDTYHAASFMKLAGGTFSGVVYARDHGTGLTDEIVNVCYGTGNPPTANLTTIGTLFVKYTA